MHGGSLTVALLLKDLWQQISVGPTNSCTFYGNSAQETSLLHILLNFTKSQDVSKSDSMFLHSLVAPLQPHPSGSVL